MLVLLLPCSGCLLSMVVNEAKPPPGRQGGEGRFNHGVHLFFHTAVTENLKDGLGRPCS